MNVWSDNLKGNAEYRESVRLEEISQGSEWYRREN